MKKQIQSSLAILTLAAAYASAQSYYIPPAGESYTVDSETGVVIKYGGGASSAGSTAVGLNDSKILGWATGYVNYTPGTDVAVSWLTPEVELGTAGGTTSICCLGNGGEITLTFANSITDGDGYDFAIFENSFSDTFLELAYVEVSSDGEHFVRFPTVSLTSAPVSAFGSVDPTNIYNLAGKYKAGYGTGYDLAELIYAYNYMTSEDNMFSTEYTADFISNYEHLDLNDIKYVKIIDIVAGNAANPSQDYDSYGNVIYDPYKTTGSGGFDLSGVAVLNAVPEPAEVAALMGLFAVAFAVWRRRRVG